MLSFDRSWLARPVLLALGCGSLLGFGGCGGAATGELGGSIDDDEGGSAGRSGGTGDGGSSAGALGGSAGRAGSGGTGVGASGGGDPGGAGGSFGGVAGFGGSAGSSAMGGAAGAGGGFGGSAGSVGAAGSASMVPSICVDLSAGLAGLPSQAFPAPDDMVDEFCGPGVSGLRVSQAICFPAPGAGQSCSSFYPDYLITELYQCGGQSSANFLCGPQQPLPGEDGCRGNECCYVLVGDCN